MSKKIVAVKNLSRDEWLNIRRKYMGGSDAAAILGLNPYTSPYAVWADKLGLLPEKEDSEALRCGRDLEEYVAKRFEETTGKKVRRAPYMLGHDKYNFIAVNLDREIVGEKAFLEAKTTSALNLKRFKSGEFPNEYYCQCVHALAVTGFDRAYLAVLIFNQAFYVYQMTTIENDTVPDWCESSVYVEPNEFEALVQAESDFWELVEAQTPPPVDGTRSTTSTLNAISDADADEEVDLLDARMDLLHLESINQQVRILAKDAEQVRQRIKEQMGGAGKANCEEYQIIWTKHQRAYIDKAALLKYCPKAIIQKVVKVAPYKSFRIRKSG